MTGNRKGEGEKNGKDAAWGGALSNLAHFLSKEGVFILLA